MPFAVDEKDLLERRVDAQPRADLGVLVREHDLRIRRSAASRSGTIFWLPTTRISRPAPAAYEPSWLPVAEAATSVPSWVTAATLPSMKSGAATSLRISRPCVWRSIVDDARPDSVVPPGFDQLAKKADVLERLRLARVDLGALAGSGPRTTSRASSPVSTTIASMLFVRSAAATCSMCSPTSCAAGEPTLRRRVTAGGGRPRRRRRYRSRGSPDRSGVAPPGHARGRPGRPRRSVAPTGAEVEDAARSKARAELQPGLEVSGRGGGDGQGDDESEQGRSVDDDEEAEHEDRHHQSDVAGPTAPSDLRGADVADARPVFSAVVSARAGAVVRRTKPS